jgi:hypothetical protein
VSIARDSFSALLLAARAEPARLANSSGCRLVAETSSEKGDRDFSDPNTSAFFERLSPDL